MKNYTSDEMFEKIKKDLGLIDRPKKVVIQEKIVYKNRPASHRGIFITATLFLAVISVLVYESEQTAVNTLPTYQTTSLECGIEQINCLPMNDTLRFGSAVNYIQNKELWREVWSTKV